jgi:mono/diheme cytochrome c family protein
MSLRKPSIPGRLGDAARSAIISGATALALCANASAADTARPASGSEVFQKWCAPCHAPGPAHPGTTALAALYKGAKPAALEERTDLSPEVTKQFVRKGVSVMPFFRKTEISDAELDALAAYLARKP